jgi:hypothetical protein
VFNASIEQLTQQMQTHSLRIRCTQAVNMKKLEALAVIDSVQQQKSGQSGVAEQFILHCHNDTELSMIESSQQIIDLAHQEQWGLYEIFSEKQTLEDIFMSLTRPSEDSKNLASGVKH